MMRDHRSLAVAVLGGLAFAGCGSRPSHTLDLGQAASASDMAGVIVPAGDMSTSAAAGADLAPTGSAPPGDLAPAAIATVRFSGTLVVAGTTTAVAGASVCVYQHPELPCAHSDAQGRFTEPVPSQSKTGLLIDAATYAGVLIAVETVSGDYASVVLELPSVASTQAFFAAATTPYPDAGKGFLRVFMSSGATQNGAAGSTAALVPSAGSPALYAGTSGDYDNTLAATSSSGLVFFGAQPPGVIEVDAHCGAGFTQQNFFGWPTSSPTKATVPIVAGYETIVGFGCS